MKHVAIPAAKQFHDHPTPVHIRGCIADELAKAAKEWEAKTGMVAPLFHFLEAANAGVTRACREHERGL